MTVDPPYLQYLKSLRQAFPQPVSDRVHDAYFVFSFLRALDHLDSMKSASPVLGQPARLDYTAAREARMANEPLLLEEVSNRLVEHLSGLFIWGHPRAQINVVPHPTIASIIGGLLPSIYNPNLVSEESSRRVGIAEVEVSAMVASLLGYDAAKAAGLFTFGGTATLLYGAKLGLERALPGTSVTGITEPAVIICSERAHYACHTVANWLGLGRDQVVTVPATADNEIRIDEFARILRREIVAGRKIAAIVATMGTTDHFGVDDLHAMKQVRDALVNEFALPYTPWLHADAVIGWAWSVFSDYSMQTNPLGFRPRTVRALAGVTRRMQALSEADSIGIDFHKTGFTPYVSSLFLVHDAAELQTLTRAQDETPYLFHDGHYHPGKYTLETSRSGSGAMAALANLLLFGKEGFRSLLGHLVTMAELLREELEGHSSTTVVNRGNFGPVTLFRVYPDGVDTFSFPLREQTEAGLASDLRRHNEYNRRIYGLVQQDALRGEGVVISLTDCYRETTYGEPIVALKSYILSPFCEEQYIEAVLESVWKARGVLAEEFG
jgi:L-2,4-diaminobutyrate decarboxylase